MSNPGSPAVSESSKSDNGNNSSNDNNEGMRSCNNGREEVAARLDPFVRLERLDMISEGQVQNIKKKTFAGATTAILGKVGKSGAGIRGVGGSGTGSVADLKVKMKVLGESPVGLANTKSSPSEGRMQISPAIVKPRRPVVHFAVDSEPKLRTVSSSLSERSKQEGGSGSRKQRSRKEKLVCRSESSSDLGIEATDCGTVDLWKSGIPPSIIMTLTTPTTPVFTSTSALSSTSTLTENINDIIAQSSKKMDSPAVPHIPRSTPTNKVKSRVKRTKSGSTGSRAGKSRVKRTNGGSTGSRAGESRVKRTNGVSTGSRAGKSRVKRTNGGSTGSRAGKSRVKRTNGGSTGSRAGESRVKRTNGGSTGSRAGGPRKNSKTASNKREPVLKKKKFIEIVSPRKRKMDHLEMVKTSSDPIFVRAANKTLKFKNKSQHNRFNRFPRVNVNKSGSDYSSGSRQQIGRASSTSLPEEDHYLEDKNFGGSLSKQRMVLNSPMNKELEAEPPCFPPSLMNELFWVLEDAEKELFPDLSSSRSTSTGASSSQTLSSQVGLGVTSSSVPLAGGSAAASLMFGRRRVESEPPGAVGFQMPPGSPAGSQTFDHVVRKEVYFSPSLSSAATGPTGRRRYSRRQQVIIPLPLDDKSCSFQGHNCPNTKVPGSQYCEKHLDQGPSAGYSHCKYLKDGRQCGNLFPSFDSTMTFCEKHANQIAKAEYELRNPKVQPDATKNLLAKINKICTEGFAKTEIDSLDASPTSVDILQIIDEPDIVPDLPLDNFTGGLLEEIDAEGERIVNPDKPDYDALKNAGFFTTEEIIQIHANNLSKLKTLYHREKELECLTQQHKLQFLKEGFDKLKPYGPRFTTNPYQISSNIDLPKKYIDHQIKEYDAAKAILQTAYKADGQKGLLRLKMLQKTQELVRMAKASGQKQHENVDICDSETDGDSDSGESMERGDFARYSGNSSVKCAYNEGYAIRACQNPPVCWSNYCFKHILSDSKQVQWIPCNRRIGPGPQDTCKTPCLKILQKHGCDLHAPLVMSKHKPLRRSEEELNLLIDSDNDEEEDTLEPEGESQVLANLVTDECTDVSHLEDMISRFGAKGSLEITDTSDSEVSAEECGGENAMQQESNDDVPMS